MENEKHNQQRPVIMIYGQTGAGKSRLARTLANKYSYTHLVIYIDTLLEHRDIWTITLEGLKQFKGGIYRIIIPPNYTPEEEEEYLNKVVSILFSRSIPTIIVLDEVSYYSSPVKCQSWLSKVIRYGRHYNIGLIACARRASETARELSAQTTEVYIFRTIEPIDIRYFNQILPKKLAELIPKLKPFHCLYYDFKGSYFIKKPVKN